jgi:hypothetical protein
MVTKPASVNPEREIKLPNPNTGIRAISVRTMRRMHLNEKIKQAAAAGYILLWLLGIPIPILLVIFLLRGCT